MAIRLLPLVLCGVAFLAYILPAQLRPSNFPADDSYFYLQIARNIVAGHGSTFNGISPTNGYHPLWMVFCVVAALLAGANKFFLMHYVFALQAGLFLGIAYLFASLSRMVGIREWVVGMPVLAGYFLTGLYASEAHLNGFTVLLTLVAFERGRSTRGVRQQLLVGCAAGLSVLARLDNVFFVAAVAMATALLTKYGGKEAVGRAVIVIASSSVIVAPYLASNLVSFGHLVPISGALKSTFPNMVGHVGNLGGLGKLSCLTAILALVLSLTVGRASRWRPLILLTSTTVLLHSSYIVLYTDHVTQWSWYYVTGALNLSFVLALVADLAPARLWMVSRRTVVVAAAVVLTTLGIVRSWQRYADPDRAGGLSLRAGGSGAHDRWQNDLGAWLKRHLPTGSKLIVYDWPGSIAYFSDLSVTPVDGLVADYAYNDDLLRMGISEYAREKGIGFYLGPIKGSARASQAVTVMAPLYERSAGELSLRPDRLVASGRMFSANPTLPALGLWKISD